jgi:hypothetical protein
MTPHELATAARRLRERTWALIARGCHPPYYGRGEVADWTLDRWERRRA